MTDSWKSGDLALCIKQGDWQYVKSNRPTEGPKAGDVLTVFDVKQQTQLSLFFSKYREPDGRMAGFKSDRFVKITPGQEIKGFEEPRRLPEPVHHEE